MQLPTTDLTDDELDILDDDVAVHMLSVRAAREIRRWRAAATTVPPALIAGISRYRQGVPPGSCLRSILENDLFAAYQRADPDTSASMPAIIAYVIEHVPSHAVGSPEAVSRYLREAEHGMRFKP